MKNVNLSRLYLHVVRFYGVSKFEVFSDIDKKWLYPKETMIEFYYDTSRNVNLKRLNRILEKHINNVDKYFVVIRDSKIIIHITYFEMNGIIDFEFSLN
jgi:hypothetical protein